MKRFDKLFNLLILLIFAGAVVSWFTLLALNTTFAFEVVLYIGIMTISIMAYAALIGLIIDVVKNLINLIPKKERKKKEDRQRIRVRARKFGYLYSRKKIKKFG